MIRKVLIFNLVYFPKFVGGAEIAVKEITDRIDPSVLEFDMVTLRVHKELPKYEKIGNINIYRVGGAFKEQSLFFKLNLKVQKYLFPWTSKWKAADLHRKNKYYAIWSIMANYAGFGALFFKNAFKNVPFILTLQEGDPLEYIEKRVGILKPLFKKIFVKADLIQVISTYLGVWAKSMGHNGQVVVIPNAVDFDLFAKRLSGDELSFLEEKFEKNESDKFIITTSRLVKKNAVDVVIKSLSYLPKNFKFLILGTGEEESGLKKITHKLGLEDRVKFLGFVPHAEMPKYLQVSDVFTRPSRSEGLGNSFLEAMASNIPVVATRAGGIPDFLKDNQTGLFVKIDDAKDLAEKIKLVCGSDMLRDEVTTNAYNMVKEKYNWDKIVSDMKTRVFGV